MPNNNQNDIRIGTYVFGSILLLFFIGVFVFAPNELSIFKQRMIAISSALLSGLFTYFFTGNIKLTAESSTTKFGKIVIQATSGIAVFILVLIWWLSPNSPINTDEKLKSIWEQISKVEIQDISAKVTLTIGDNVDVPEIFRYNSQLELKIIENSELDTTKIKGWKNGFFISNKSLNLISANQSFNRQVNNTTGGITIDLIREYKDFTGNLYSLEDLQKWSKSSFEAIIRVSETNKWLDTLANNKNSDFYVSREKFNNYYDVTESQKKSWESQEDYHIYVHPITATLKIFVNGTSIGKAVGIVIKVKEWDEDVRSLFVIKFPVTKLNT